MNGAVVDDIRRRLQESSLKEVAIGWDRVDLTSDPVQETRDFDFCLRDLKWLVIGTAGGCGDPLVIDTLDPSYPVFCINHDTVDDPVLSPDPHPVADSLEGFLTSLSKLSHMLATRNATVSYEDAPMDSSEIEAFVAQHLRSNPSSDGFFWRLLLERDRE